MAITFNIGGSSTGKKRYRFGDYWPQTIGIGGLMVAVDGWAELGSLGDPTITVATAVALVAFFIAFFKKLKDYRSVANVSTSRIATAAQGFAEFNCKVRPDNKTYVAPIIGMECAWFHYIQRERRGSGKNARWVVVMEQTSNSPIWLTDDSGESMLAHPCYLIQSDIGYQKESNSGVFTKSLEHVVYYLQGGDAVMVNGQFASFDAVGMPLARHMVGPKSKSDDITKCLGEIKEMLNAQVQADTGAEPKAQAAGQSVAKQRLHAIGYCDFNDMGMIHLGSEEAYLKSKKLGLVLSVVGLSTAFAAVSTSLIQLLWVA